MEHLEFNTDGFSTATFNSQDIPTEDQVSQSLTAIGNELGDLMLNTALEPVLEQISTRWTSQLHSLIGSYERRRDEQVQELKSLIGCADGSEIQSGQMEDLTSQVRQLDEIIETLELMRDTMAQNHNIMTGQTWRPHAGSKKSRYAGTGAILEAREYLEAKEKADAIRKAPQGFLVAVTGTANFVDIERAYDVLDQCREKHPDMKVITGGHSKGIDKIAASWAAARHVDVIVTRPDFKKHGKGAAPFKRNEAVIAMKPGGVLVFLNKSDANGVAMNLFQKSEDAGIPARRYVQAAS